MPAPHPADRENRRLRTLGEYQLIGAPPIPDLESVVELAASLCEAGKAVVNILTDHQQHQIATVGFRPTVCSRDMSMCAVAIEQPEPVLVTDARADPRFADNPHVTGVLDRIRFYAASQLRAPDGEVLGTLCVFDQRIHDLTTEQQHRLDKLARVVVDILELRRHSLLLHTALRDVEAARDELTRSNTALHHFAAQVSHDLRNPLTGVLGYLGTLTDLPAVAADPEARDVMARATSSGTRMWQMIDAVLAHAAVGGHLHLQQVHLGDVVAEVLSDLEPAVRAARATVTVDRLPCLTGDRTQLRVLLQNLIGNAVKFRHPDRPCRIHLTARPDGLEWAVQVQDNGVGVPAPDRQRVTQLGTRLRPDVEGFGVGLATCLRIAAAHHGRLRLDGAPGGGTTVVVTLPAAPTEALAPTNALAPASAR